jgi:hypothetical protein
MLQVFHPIGTDASSIGRREGLACYRTTGPKDIALAAPAIIALLAGTCRPRRLLGGRGNAHSLLPGEALGRFQAHVIQADPDTSCGGRREFLHAPLLGAHSGSTRAPHQVSCVRQRSPAAISRSSIWLRLLARAVCSCKYAASRSRVHEANGNPSCSGGVRAVVITAAIRGGGRELNARSTVCPLGRRDPPR